MPTIEHGRHGVHPLAHRGGAGAVRLSSHLHPRRLSGAVQNPRRASTRRTTPSPARCESHPTHGNVSSAPFTGSTDVSVGHAARPGSVGLTAPQVSMASAIMAFGVWKP